MINQYIKTTTCSECGSEFTSKNVRTHRCDECKGQNGVRISKSWTRNCCICNSEFNSRNIYTVTCSQKCGHIASNNGQAQIAKQAIKDTHQKKRDERATKKRVYQSKLLSQNKVLRDCQTTWPCHTYRIDEFKPVRPEVIVYCDKHGESVWVYNRYEKPSNPCVKCRTNHNKLSHQQYVDRCNTKFDYKYTYITEYQSGDKGWVVYYCPHHGLRKMLCRKHYNSPTGCTECTKEVTNYSRSNGCFSWNLLERDVELATTPYTLYFAGGDNYSKVGLTTESGRAKRQRELKKQAGLYDFKVIHSGTLLECFELEQFILSETESVKPDKHFGGHTECFSSDLLGLLNIINGEIKCQ